MARSFHQAALVRATVGGAEKADAAARYFVSLFAKLRTETARRLFFCGDCELLFP
jgi:hypothetical protein